MVVPTMSTGGSQPSGSIETLVLSSLGDLSDQEFEFLEQFRRLMRRYRSAVTAISDGPPYPAETDAARDAIYRFVLDLYRQAHGTRTLRNIQPAFFTPEKGESYCICCGNPARTTLSVIGVRYPLCIPHLELIVEEGSEILSQTKGTLKEKVYEAMYGELWDSLSAHLDNIQQELRKIREADHADTNAIAFDIESEVTELSDKIERLHAVSRPNSGIPEEHRSGRQILMEEGDYSKDEEAHRQRFTPCMICQYMEDPYGVRIVLSRNDLKLGDDFGEIMHTSCYHALIEAEYDVALAKKRVSERRRK